ncbi:MAG: hypothetical protein ACREHE_02210 [Rhizomicrobium sp.]
MRFLLLLVGLVALALGIYWILEGMNYLNYTLPYASAYIPSYHGIRTGAYYGAGVALLGLIVIFYSRRA